MRRILHRHEGLIRMIASAYFMLGADAEDLRQEGRVGAFKAVRDFRPGNGSGFRNFLDLCVRRQVITAAKAASRRKHSPLNEALSLRGTVSGSSDIEDPMLEEVLADERRPDPVSALEAKEEFEAVRATFCRLSALERQAVGGIASGLSYEQVAEDTGRGFKTIDNAAQRAKRKIREGLEAAA
jgi:RNA polymerase sporulation-specific sigma factor